MLSRLLTRKEQFVLLTVAIAVCVGAAALYYHNAAQTPDAPLLAEPLPPPLIMDAADGATAPLMVAPPPEQVPAPAEIRVAAAGAVHRAGLYTMRPDARVQDLIDAAGGALPSANLEDINRAAHLIDGTTLTLPSVQAPPEANSLIRRPTLAPVSNPPQYLLSGWATQTEAAPIAVSQPFTSPSGATSDGRIDPNRATSEELQTLPGIGPVLADRIIDYRSKSPFRTVDDLSQVSGIGPKKLEAIRDLILVQGM